MSRWILFVSRDLDNHLANCDGCRCSRGRLLAQMLMHALAAAGY